jgi:hypothetical protein
MRVLATTAAVLVLVGLAPAAADQILAWVADRFAGRPAGSACAEGRNQR